MYLSFFIASGAPRRGSGLKPFAADFGRTWGFRECSDIYANKTNRKNRTIRTNRTALAQRVGKICSGTEWTRTDHSITKTCGDVMSSLTST